MLRQVDYRSSDPKLMLRIKIDIDRYKQPHLKILLAAVALATDQTQAILCEVRECAILVTCERI